MSPSAESTPAAPAVEPCPAPLEWRVVLDEFRRGCRAFNTVDHSDGRTIRGWSFGEGSPLYVVGAATGNHELFALLAWLLKDACCCVFVEPPEIGWPVRSAAELPRQTGALLAAAAHLGHEHIAILGVGFGSCVALDACLNDPDRVAALAVLQGTPQLSVSLTERGLHSYGSCVPGSIGSIPGWRGVQQQNHRAWFPPFDGSRFDFLIENLSQTPTAQYARRMQLWSSLDFRPQLKRIETPLLLVNTEGQGRNISAGMEELRSGVAEAQVESLHSAGLHPYLTHPHRVAKLIRTFVESTTQSRQLA